MHNLLVQIILSKYPQKASLILCEGTENEVVVNQSLILPFSKHSHAGLQNLTTRRDVYTTMTKTDVALLERIHQNSVVRKTAQIMNSAAKLIIESRSYIILRSLKQNFAKHSLKFLLKVFTKRLILNQRQKRRKRRVRAMTSLITSIN